MAMDILTLGAAGLVSKLLKGKKSTPAPTPAPTGPAVMPLPDDDKIALARKRGIIRQMGRAGRESTMLTGTKLGG